MDSALNDTVNLNFSNHMVEISPSLNLTELQEADSNNKNECQQIQLVEPNITHILNLIKDVVMTCKEGNMLYGLSHSEIPSAFEFEHLPLLSNYMTDPCLINPRHSKLSWQRVVKGRQKRFENFKQKTSTSITLQVEKNFFPQPDHFNYSSNISSCSFNKNTDKIGQFGGESKDLVDSACKPKESKQTMSFKQKSHYHPKEPANNFSDINNNNPTSTSEESLDVTIPNKFQKLREFSRKEQELRNDKTLAACHEGRKSQRLTQLEFTSTESFPSSSLTTIDCRQSSQSFNDGPRSKYSDKNLVDRLTKLLNDLKSLWLNVNELGVVPYITDFDDSCGDLALRLVNLCSVVVKEMEAEWRSFVSSATDKDKLAELESLNRVLTEQLESTLAVQSCVKGELKYMAKVKANLNEEVKALSMQLAAIRLNDKEKPCKKSSSNTSLGFEISPSPSPSKENLKENRVKNREADFKNLLDVVKSHNVDMTYYQTQFDEFAINIKALEIEVHDNMLEKAELSAKYAKLYEEHQELLKGNDQFESTLKLVLKEKDATGQHSIYELIQVLINKLNSMEISADAPTKAEANSVQIGHLQGDLKSIQDQNIAYREEILQLKSKLDKFSDHDNDKSELESKYAESQKKVQELTKLLNEKRERDKANAELCKKKERQWQDHCKSITSEKNKLENLVEEKEFELKKQMDSFEGLEKRNLRQEKRLQDMHKCNSRCKHEIQDQKHNMESLSSIVHQLRSSLQEQKTQWTERIKAVNDDALQAKDHCRWLQSQVEHLNSLVADGNERVKSHERDKTNLAQHLISSEEERKLVDRKLQELHVALQGDSVLREALMERNEVLQAEINRLRRAKIANLGKSIEAWKDDGDFDTPPPSEMSNVDPAQIVRTSADKGIIRKNCYTTAYGTNRRPIEVPRSTISLHSSGIGQGNPGVDLQNSHL